MHPLIRSHLLIWPLAVVVAGCGDNTDDAAPGAAPAGGAITLWTDSTELFMEHPALIVGAPDKFAVHLTDISDFAPLTSGRITLRFQPRDGGDPLVVVQDTPRSPGIYGPAPSFTKAGIYDLTLTVESPQANDVIKVPALRVYATADEAPKEETGEPGGIPFLKEQQWKTPGFSSHFATTGNVTETLAATGDIVPVAGKMAVVSAPIAGLIEQSGLAQSPAPGQRVQRGQVLAVLTPTIGEGGSAYAEARAALREAQDEFARAERLYAVEAVPQRRVQEAEIRLNAAREALSGLAGSENARSDGKLVIRSPLSGVVTSRTIAPGSRVEAGTELFTILDPDVVWLRVHVPASAAERVVPASGANFIVAGSDSLRRSGRTVSVGSVIDSMTRTLPVIFEVSNRDHTLKVGGTVQVLVPTRTQANGVIIPSSAVLEEDGRPIAYVQAEGERFERRELDVAGSDGDNVLLRSGIAAGERVVTGAAYQVRLASLSTSVPAHGHEH